MSRRNDLEEITIGGGRQETTTGTESMDEINKIVQEQMKIKAENRTKRILLIKAIGGELLCTTLFIFIVCATSYNYHRQKNQYTSEPLIGAIATGFSSVALIYSFADVSGANFNPAVTFATYVTGKINALKCAMYIIAQMSGAIMASLLLLIAFPGNTVVKDVVAHRSADTTIWEALVMEAILTYILVYVIFATAFDKIENTNENVKVDFDEDEMEAAVQTGKVSSKTVRPKLTVYTTGGNSKGGFAPIAIGFTLGFLVFIGGTVSGGCFNPARAFGPALVAWDWGDQWIYWLADFFGAALAGYTQMIFAHDNPDPLVLFRPLIEYIQKKRTNQY